MPCERIALVSLVRVIPEYNGRLMQVIFVTLRSIWHHYAFRTLTVLMSRRAAVTRQSSDIKVRKIIIVRVLVQFDNNNSTPKLWFSKYVSQF